MDNSLDDSFRTAKRVLEAALLSTAQPLSWRDMDTLFAGAMERVHLETLIEQLQMDWSERGLELLPVSSGWRFQTRLDVHLFLERLHPEKPQRYSRATLETLAIIAYRQPCTRGDMEDIRGVTINSQIIKQLEDRGWIESIGHRETVGRPALYATTKQFLDDLGLVSLAQLPPMESPPENALERLNALAQETVDAGEVITRQSLQAGARDLFSPASAMETRAEQGAASQGTETVEAADPLAQQDSPPNTVE